MELNKDAADAMLEAGVHAATDVTGFGLAGHLHEMLESSGVPDARRPASGRSWTRPPASSSSASRLAAAADGRKPGYSCS